MSKLSNMYGKGFLSVFSRTRRNDDLVRLFRTEYPHEYNYATKSGFEVTPNYVKEYLNNH